MELRSKRILLRPWRDADLEPFAAMGADPQVMAHFPGLLSRAESDAFVERIRAHFATHGFGLWALEVDGAFVGFAGLHVPAFEAHFTPCVEIAWRLASRFWGRGYASEAARRALAFAFEERGLAEVVSMTVPANVRSQRVMAALGMLRDPADDFEHPRLPPGHVLRPHVLHRLSRPRYRALAFAAALDGDDFEAARRHLSASCEYAIGEEVLRGPDAILGSYEEATTRAHARFDEVRYESAVETDAPDIRILYTDILRRGDRVHRHQCHQRLSFDAAGLIARIVHEPIAGEREALLAFESVR